MLQYLQPSSNAIQNMLIQQILTSPEQVYNSYDVTGQLVYIHIHTYPSLSLFIKRLWSFMKPTICVFSYIDYEQYDLLSHFFSLLLLSLSFFDSPSFFDIPFVARQTSHAQDVAYSVRL